MKKSLSFSGGLQGITFNAKKPFRELQVLSVRFDFPVRQINHPAIAIVVKTANKVFTAISRLEEMDGSGFHPINIMKRLGQITDLDADRFDTVEIRPYNFSMHPKQHVSVEINYN
jgi:hypothetical protein